MSQAALRPRTIHLFQPPSSLNAASTITQCCFNPATPNGTFLRFGYSNNHAHCYRLQLCNTLQQPQLLINVTTTTPSSASVGQNKATQMPSGWRAAPQAVRLDDENAAPTIGGDGADRDETTNVMPRLTHRACPAFIPHRQTSHMPPPAPPAPCTCPRERLRRMQASLSPPACLARYR